jgi:hypothetical protein
MLFLTLAGPKGRLKLRWQENDVTAQLFVECHDLNGFLWHLDVIGDRVGPSAEPVVQAAPCPPDRDGLLTGATLPCHALWAVVDTGEGAAKLARFRPRPTIVLREGDTIKRTAVWALTRPLQWEYTVKGNRRLAHQFQGPKKFVQPDHALRTPGSFVVDGRVVPIPVVPDELNPQGLYTAAQVVKHLREPPDPNGWRKRQEAAA